jgi:tetratricopeptide (TPR) repeat protein
VRLISRTGRWGFAWAFLLGFVAVGCAAQRHIRQGDDLLSQGRYAEAVSAYEHAIAADPDDAAASARLRKARGLVAGAALAQVQEKLRQGDDLGAMQLAADVRAMPIDLEDVRLVRRIDQTVSRVVHGVKSRIESAIGHGHWLVAAELSRHLLAVSPKDGALRAYAEQVTADAIEHYRSLANERRKARLRGSAALQLALAQRVGAPVSAAEVGKLWHRFASSLCFSRPRVVVTAKGAGEVARAAVEPISEAIEANLESMLVYCKRGGSDLTVRVALRKGERSETRDRSRAVKALPGAELVTEEVYFEEEP